MSGRKRGAEEAKPGISKDNNESDQDEGAEFERRRKAAAEGARRRAAHFAQYSDEPADNSNVHHAGLPDNGNLGPFSTAAALLQARDRAIEQRKQRFLDTHTTQNNTAAHPPWQPSRDASSLGKRTLPPSTTNHANNNGHYQRHTGPPSLSTLALQVIIQYIDCVESLNGIPDSERSRISAALRATRRTTPDIFLLFTADRPQELVIHDCTNLDPEVLETGLVRTAAVSNKLQKVELGLCGRGFTPKVAEAFASAIAAAAAAGGGGGAIEGKDKGAASSPSSPPSSQLMHLSLSGAYLLNDKGLLSILKASPNLTVLSLPQACRLIGSQCNNNSSINMLPRLCPHLRELNLNECRGIDSDGLHQALSGLLATTLEELSLDGLGGQITDDFMASLLPSSTSFPKLRHVSLARCIELTDKGLLEFVRRAPCLESLVLDECKGVTSLGLLHMFGIDVVDLGGDSNNDIGTTTTTTTTTTGALAAAVTTKPLAVVPPFKSLKLRKCQVDDSVLVTMAAACPDLTILSLNGCKQITSGAILAVSHAACRYSLQYLDLSWCRKVSQEALGALADACPRLETLVLWGCGGNQAGRVFLDGHSNDGLTVIGCGEEEGAV
jgi:DNA repair protein RAD7